MAGCQPTSTSADIYASVPIHRDQIRILQLHPGSREENIRCELLTANSLAPESYEALSYVWGDPKDTRTIEVQGQKMAVTMNLAIALRYLRDPIKKRSLWVDALCINQKDSIERNTQVGMMNTIYRNAWNVVIWLGADENQNVLRLIQKMGLDPHRHWKFLAYVGDDQDPALAIIDLFIFMKEVRWYTRIWTVQEVVLAKSVTYVCGDFAFANGEIDGLLKSFRLHFMDDNCCDADEVTAQVGIGNISNQMYPYIRQVSDMLDITDEQRAGHSQSSFLALASRLRHRQATNTRDKVFGILGLTSDLPNSIIDYDATVADVYATAAVKLIEKNGNLDVLSHVLPRVWVRYHWLDPHIPPVGLPSWAPDWSDDRPKEYWRLTTLSHRQMYANFFRAHGRNSTPRPRSCSDDLKRLVLEGRHCGFIAALGQPFEPESMTDSSSWTGCQFQQWREMANVDQEPQQAYGSLVDSYPPVTILDAFWRTLCADIDPLASTKGGKIQGADLRTRACHDEWWWSLLKQTKYRDIVDGELEFKSGPLIMTNKLRSFQSHVGTISAGRRFFISSTGLFGLGPQDAQEGDQIWVVNGGKMPLILRPTSNAYEPSYGNKYMLVGDSYVYGIMKGEAVESSIQETVVTLI